MISLIQDIYLSIIFIIRKFPVINASKKKRSKLTLKILFSVTASLRLLSDCMGLKSTVLKRLQVLNHSD